MAKSQVSLTVPNNIDEKIDRFQREEGLEYKSEATRQLIEAGVELRSKTVVTVPENVGEEVERYRDERGVGDQSEAIRQLIEAGVQAQAESGPGERLAETATSIAGVASVIAVGASMVGVTAAWGLVIPSLTATFLFSMLWASIRSMAGKDLV